MLDFNFQDPVIQSTMATVHPSRLGLVPQGNSSSYNRNDREREEYSHSRRRDGRDRDEDRNRGRERNGNRDENDRQRRDRSRSQSATRNRERDRPSNRRQSPDYSAYRREEPPHLNGNGNGESAAPPWKAPENMYHSRDGRRRGGEVYNAGGADFIERCATS